MAIGSWSYQRPAMRRDVSMKELPTVDTNTIARFSSSLVFHLRIKVLPGFPVPTACAGFQLRENMLFFSRKLNVEKAPKLWSKTTQMHLSNHILTVPWLVHEISSRCAPSSRLVGNGDRMTRSAATLWSSKPHLRMSGNDLRCVLEYNNKMFIHSVRSPQRQASLASIFFVAAGSRASPFLA